MQKKTIWDLNRPTTEEFRRSRKNPLVLVLDNIRSLNNIGSMFRTSDAFAVERICLCGITACPPSPEIHKTALGAEDSVEWTYYGDTLDAIAELKGDGYTVCCLEQVKESISLENFEVEKSKRYARQLKVGKVRETGKILSATDRAFRAGYLSAQHDSARAFCSANGIPSQAKKNDIARRKQRKFNKRGK